MSVFGAIGTQVLLVFQTKFPTFTHDQFSNALKERKFSVAPAQIPNLQDPKLGFRSVHLFSKGNVSIFLDLSQHRINFQILNMVDLSEIYEDIKSILLALNVTSNIVSNIVFNCTTSIRTDVKPQEKLTTLVDSKLLKTITDGLGVGFDVISIRLATEFPLGREGSQIIIEPLGSFPDDHYYLNFLYQTTDMNKFNEFISDFGKDTIQMILNAVEGGK